MRVPNELCFETVVPTFEPDTGLQYEQNGYKIWINVRCEMIAGKVFEKCSIIGENELHVEKYIFLHIYICYFFVASH